MFLTSLGIGGERLEIRANHRGDAATLRMPGDLGGACLSLPERLLQALQRDRLPDLPAMPEAVGDRLGDAEDLHGNILDVHGQDIVGEQRVCEPHNPHLRPSLLRHPVPGADRHPDRARKLVGQFVVGQRGHQADDAPGNALRGLCQAVVGVKRRVGQLVEAAREAVHLAGANHSADCGRGDACIRELGQARNSLHPKEIDRLVALRTCFHH